MKKLNKKGFTLVELLAVIVILAVIMVITIPTVLGSMRSAKDKSLDAAIGTMEEYVEKQITLCKADLGDLTDNHDGDIINSDCEYNDNHAELLAATGYTEDIEISSVSVENGVATITATAKADGQFE